MPKSFRKHLDEAVAELSSDRKVYTERGLTAYLKTAESMVKNAQTRSGEFSKMQDVHISVVLGRLVAHITRIVNTVPQGTDPNTVRVAKSLMSLGARAARIKKHFDDLAKSGSDVAARLSSDLQSKYDMRFESLESEDAQQLHERVVGQEMQAAANRSFDALKSEYTKKMNEALNRLWKFYDSEKKGGRDLLDPKYRVGGESEADAIERIFYANSGISRLHDQTGVILVFNSNSTRGLAVVPSSIKGDMSKVGGDFLMVFLCESMTNAAGSFCAIRHGCNDATIKINMSQGSQPLNTKFFTRAAEMVMKSGGRNKASEKIRNLTTSIDALFNSYRSIYIHEYTHYLDEIRYKGDASKSIKQSSVVFWDKTQQDKTAYFVAENEVNARLSEVEGMARSALRDYLIAATSDATAYDALLKLKSVNSTMKDWDIESVFNNTQNQALRNGLVSQQVEMLVSKKMETIKQERVSPLLGLMGSEQLRKDPYLWLLVLMAQEVISRPAIEAWNKNPKIMKKAVSRLYGVAAELRKQQGEYLKGLANGKTPSKQSWMKSIEACRFSYGTIMYSGHFMKSFSTDVYSTKTKYYMADTHK